MEKSLHNLIEELFTALVKLMHRGIIFNPKGFFNFVYYAGTTVEDMNKLLLHHL